MQIYNIFNIHKAFTGKNVFFSMIVIFLYIWQITPKPMKTFSNPKNNYTRAAMLLLMLLAMTLTASATDFITDVMVAGNKNERPDSGRPTGRAGRRNRRNI